MTSIKLGLTLLGFSVVHFSARAFAAKVVAKKIVSTISIDKSLAGENREGRIQAGNIKRAFLKNTQPLRSIFRPMPVGWSMRSKRLLAEVTADACEFIQTMNDRYTRPSGNQPQIDETATNADQVENIETLQAVKSESTI